MMSPEKEASSWPLRQDLQASRAAEWRHPTQFALLAVWARKHGVRVHDPSSRRPAIFTPINIATGTGTIPAPSYKASGTIPLDFLAISALSEGKGQQNPRTRQCQDQEKKPMWTRRLNSLPGRSGQRGRPAARCLRWWANSLKPMRGRRMYFLWALGVSA